MTGIIKVFSGVRALNCADFTLLPGEVHALLGINGAGKSTLIKVLSGVYQKDAGEIRMNEKHVEFTSPQAAINHGIATVYQDPQMIPSFTGYENIFLGTESDSHGLFPRIRRRDLRRRADALLQKFPVEVDLTRPVGELSAVEKESIAILRALSHGNMAVLVLDEPTSILTKSEIEILFKQIRSLKERGISIIYITHRLDEVFEIADRFTVFRDGKNVATHKTTDTGMDHAKIAEFMLGKKLDKVFPEKGVENGEILFSVNNLGLTGGFHDLTFSVKKGSILGIFGLVGSGIDELCKSLFGVLPCSNGSMEILGRKTRHRSPGEAISNGLFLVPGDRRQEGQIADESVLFNMTLANLERISIMLGFIRHRIERQDSVNLVHKLDIKTPDVAENISLLSGGNQQKAVIGKGLYTNSNVYVFQEPTTGVDVGAKAGIYQLIRELAREKAVIVVGSDCEEILGLCDNAMVMYKGRVVMDKTANEVRLDKMLLYGLTGKGVS